MQAKNSDRRDEVLRVVAESLTLRQGEVLTEGLIMERAANITMAVFAVLPTIHSIRLTSSLQTGGGRSHVLWMADPDKGSPLAGVAGVAFTARDAVVNFFKDLYWRASDRTQEGPQLFEIDVGRLP